MERQGLCVGNCSIEKKDDRFIVIQQEGRAFHYAYKRSENSRFVVAWKPMLNFRQEKSNQVCLIEKDRNILWTEEFRRAVSGDVSDDGTVAIHDINLEPLVNNKSQVAYQFSHSLVVITKDSRKFKFDFGTQAEVVSFKLSQDGTLLVYNLQQYHPNDYRLVLHNLQTNKEEWRYKYPQDQVVHELEFNGQRILVYSGPRPSAYVDRRYSFTLDLAGKLVENDAAESQKQKERDSTAALAKNAADRVIQILTANLAEVAPTIEAESKSEYGTRSVSLGMTSIMRGERPLPALHIQVCPIPQGSQFKRETSNTEETARKFFLHIEVIAESIEKRDETVGKCLKTLTRNEEEFVRNNLAITNTPQTRNIPSYSGGGPYLRARISTIVAFPSKEGVKKIIPFEEVLKLQPNESVNAINDVLVKVEALARGSSEGFRFGGKLVLTNQQLRLFLKNPISGSFRSGYSLPLESCKTMVFEDEEKCLKGKGVRIYFKSDASTEFEAFKKKLMQT